MKCEQCGSAFCIHSALLGAIALGLVAGVIQYFV
jgi:hypothetical protein